LLTRRNLKPRRNQEVGVQDGINEFDLKQGKQISLSQLIPALEIEIVKFSVGFAVELSVEL